jgi:signal transduction histidine kinase
VDNHWQIAVSDNGIGIDPALTSRLFQVFQRLHPRSAFEGSGVGLALCRRILERHNGHIWIESEGDGKGSTFRFSLPAAMEAEPASADSEV